MIKIGIEQLLSWAFVMELPKAGTADALDAGESHAWKMMSEVALLGTVVDRSPNAFGVLPDLVYTGEPHEDAMAVGEAVRALAQRSFDIDPRWAPFPEWKDASGLIAAEVQRLVGDLVTGRSERLNGRHVISLVTRCAVLKRRPDWTIGEEPDAATISLNGRDAAWFRMVTVKIDGREVQREVDGFNYKRRRPYADAYNKTRLRGSIIGDMFARLDWQLWCSALDELFHELRPVLRGHDLQQASLNRQPWAISGNSKSETQVIENA